MQPLTGREVMQPLTMNHIGINVPDIERACVWYSDIFGFQVLSEPAVVEADDSHFGHLVKDIFGPNFRSMKMAHLVTGDGVGIELFQFLDPKTVVPENTYEYWRAGIFHFSLTVSDMDACLESIQSSDGKIISKTWKLYKNKPYRSVYCQDPWGTIFELYSSRYEQYWSNHEPPKS